MMIYLFIRGSGVTVYSIFKFLISCVKCLRRAAFYTGYRHNYIRIAAAVAAVVAASTV